MSRTEFSASESTAMDAALRAALGGMRGANPLVGAAVLAHDGRVVTGYHRGAGTAHAEVDAIARARNAAVDLATSTLLVTLEPCNHTGRTGPCSQHIVDSGIRDVVFAVADPNPQAGGGARTLRAAGVRVRSGLRESQARELNRRWLVATTAQRPFVTAKIAQSLDGYSAAADGTSQWITGPAARARAHEIRATVSAIVVGTGTALADDPRLTARGADGKPLASQPVPVVIGDRELPAGSHLAGNPELLHYGRFTAGARGESGPATRRGDGSADTAQPPRASEGDHGLAGLVDILRDLRAHGHDHVLVEGGPTLVGAFLQADLVDSLLVFTAPMLLGTGRSSVALPGIATLGDSLRLAPDPVAAPESLGPDVLDHFVPNPLETRGTDVGGHRLSGSAGHDSTAVPTA